MPSFLRAFSEHHAASGRSMGLPRIMETLEDRTLLSGLPSGETAYIRFNTSSTNLGTWFEVKPVNITSASDKPSGGIQFSAPLDTNSTNLLPAVQESTKFPSVNLRITKTVAGVKKVIQAEQYNNVAVTSLEWLGSGSQPVQENFAIKFSSEKANTTQASVPAPIAQPPATGPFDLTLENSQGKLISSGSSDAFRINTFALKIADGSNGKPAAEFGFSKNFDETGTDLGEALVNNRTLSTIGLYVHQGPLINAIGQKLNNGGERMAFNIGQTSVDSIHWTQANGALNESFEMFVQPGSLRFELKNNGATVKFPTPVAADTLASFLQLNKSVTSNSATWNGLTSVQISLSGTPGKPIISVEGTETYTGAGRASQHLSVNTPYADANLVFADTVKKKVKGEFSFSAVKITNVSSTTSNGKTTENFTFSAAGLLTQLYPVNSPPASIPGWNRVHNITAET